MSAASQERQRQRMLLHKRRGHVTIESFRAWQESTLAAWFAGATFIGSYPNNPPTLAITQAQRQIQLDGGEPMTYPEPTIPDPQ